MRELDEFQVIRMIREKGKGTPNRLMSEEAGVSVRWVQEMTKKCRGVKAGETSYPATMGRPRNSLPRRRGHSAILSTLPQDCGRAVSLEMKIDMATGMQRISHKEWKANDDRVERHSSSYLIIRIADGGGPLIWLAENAGRPTASVHRGV